MGHEKDYQCDVSHLIKKCKFSQEKSYPHKSKSTQLDKVKTISHLPSRLSQFQNLFHLSLYFSQWNLTRLSEVPWHLRQFGFMLFPLPLLTQSLWRKHFYFPSSVGTGDLKRVYQSPKGHRKQKRRCHRLSGFLSLILMNHTRHLIQICCAEGEYLLLVFQERGKEECPSYLCHRHSLRRATVQNDHPIDWHFLPLGVLLKVFSQVCVGR